MLFFIDETWQEIDGQEVAALGGVAIPQRGYNAFCREVFALKRDLLGAVELRDAELKGKKCFAKRAFRKRDEGHRSKLIEAGDALFDLLKRHHARTFVIWTVDPALVSLRSTETTFLSAAYVQLLFDFRAYMRREAKKALGSLNFDQRDFGSDEAAACALQNYLVRTRSVDWRRHFLTVPSFSVSAISPGLQAADLVAHLGAHLYQPDVRPELAPFHARVASLRYEWGHGRQSRNSIRQVRARQEAGGLAS